jgi:predicted dehydrogenase
MLLDMIPVQGGGGIFKDMAVHDLDMSRFLMGSEPKVRPAAIRQCSQYTRR